MWSSQNRPPPMSSVCLLSVEKLWSKNKFNQRSEKMQKERKTSQARQNNNSLDIQKSQGPFILPQGLYSEPHNHNQKEG